MRYFVPLVVLFAAVACKASRPTAVLHVSSTAAANSPERALALVPAPAWVVGYCKDARRLIGRSMLCLGRVPDGFGPTDNLGVLRPSAHGYLFEAVTDRHWAFDAGDDAATIGPSRPAKRLGNVRVRSTRGTWFYGSSLAGILANHLILNWREGGFDYALSVHTRTPTNRLLRDLLLKMADGMRRY